MSISFVLTAILTQPNVMEVLRGMFIPSFNSKDTLTIVGILGTTCSTRVTQLILVDDKEIKREQESENNKKAWGILTQWSKPFLCLFKIEFLYTCFE
jgi:Mn2+/Fe2+ NRAMP family transporter